MAFVEYSSWDNEFVVSTTTLRIGAVSGSTKHATAIAIVCEASIKEVMSFPSLTYGGGGTGDCVTTTGRGRRRYHALPRE